MLVEVFRYLDPLFEDYEKEIARYDVASLPLFKTPTIWMAAVVFYLFLVFWLAPMYMKNREPYKMQKYLQVYNLSHLVVLLVLLVFSFVNNTWRVFWTMLTRNRVMLTLQEVRLMGWLFAVLKLLELCETIHFILRKKHNQVSFLHVYHHTSISVLAWIYLRYFPVQQVCIVVMMNGFVHLFMYLYYLVTTMGPKFKKYLRVKMYITALQMVQFIVAVIYAVSTILEDNALLKIPSYIIFFHAGSFLILFSQFFINEYIKKDIDLKNK